MNIPETPETAIKTPKGRRYWGGHIQGTGNHYSYWIRYGDEPDMLLHIDTKGKFTSEEIDDITDYMLWARTKEK